jgi:hypothetical protein
VGNLRSDVHRRNFISAACRALFGGRAYSEEPAFRNTKWAKPVQAGMVGIGRIRPLDNVVDSGRADMVGSQVGGIVNILRSGHGALAISGLKIEGDLADHHLTGMLGCPACLSGRISTASPSSPEPPSRRMA